MSSAARDEIPGAGDDRKVHVYDEANDEWDLSSGPVPVITVGTTAPASPLVGDLWGDTN